MATNGAEWCVAIYEFEGENDNELTFKEGDFIQIYSKQNEWWEGATQDGRIGLFPANRVALYHPEETNTTAAATIVKSNSGNSANQGNKQNLNNNYMKQVSEQKLAADGPQSPGRFQPHPPSQPRAPSPPPSQQQGAEAKAQGDRRGGGDKGGDKGGEKGGEKGGKGDGAPRKPQSKTRFGPWATSMAYMSAVSTVFLAIGSMDWGAEDSFWGILYVGIGVYSFFISLIVVAYEYYVGGTRSNSRFPLRAIAYFAIAVPMFLTYPTLFGGLLFAITGIVSFIAAYLGEEYEAPKSENAQQKAGPKIEGDTICAQLYNWVQVKRQQNKFGLVVFVSLYFIANIVIFFVALAEWIDKNNQFTPNTRLSAFGPWAKAFGNTLDLNCAIIVVPVLRSIIRWLYNLSTADEGCIARCLRGILAFVPLDKNLAFHKLIAKMIVVGTFGHTLMHLFNYARAPGPSYDRFGVWPWISGGIVCACMLLIYSATVDNVKRFQFEIFWYSHHCFIGFFFFLLLHGAGGWNPNYWKWFLLPGTLYIIERLLRVYRARQDVVLLSVTNMKPNVFSLEFAKQGVFASPYKEGQYIFLSCPKLSAIQWHPFTISSAPQEKTVTVHIKKQGPGSWTTGLFEYVSAMGPKNATYYELTRQGDNGAIPGKVQGPDGLPLLQIDGPHSAPTQHVSEYNTAIIAGAGIGVTPVAATLKSVVLHRWKYFMGHCFPDNAYFCWVCAHNDIDSFRWLMRAIKDCADEIADMRAKNAKDMGQKRFEFHIYVTSVPKNVQREEVVVDDDIGFWGRPREDRHLEKVRAPFDELDIYQTMKCPPPHTAFGDVHIWEGRPKWDERFQSVKTAHPKGDIGVAFCGNPFIGKDLQDMCFKYSSIEDERIFRLHKENF